MHGNHGYSEFELEMGKGDKVMVLVRIRRGSTLTYYQEGFKLSGLKISGVIILKDLHRLTKNQYNSVERKYQP